MFLSVRSVPLLHAVARALLTAWSCCWLRSAVQIKNGCQFVSETDTEVIPKLLKFAYDNWEGERLPFPKVSWAQPQQYAGRDSARQTETGHAVGSQLQEMPAAQTLSWQRPDMQRWCQHMPARVWLLSGAACWCCEAQQAWEPEAASRLQQPSCMGELQQHALAASVCCRRCCTYVRVLHSW